MQVNAASIALFYAFSICNTKLDTIFPSSELLKNSFSNFKFEPFPGSSNMIVCLVFLQEVRLPVAMDNCQHCIDKRAGDKQQALSNNVLTDKRV